MWLHYRVKHQVQSHAVVQDRDSGVPIDSQIMGLSENDERTATRRAQYANREGVSAMPKLYRPVSKAIRKHVIQDERGASMIEYVVIASLISIVAITIMQQIGGKVVGTFQAIFDVLP